MYNNKVDDDMHKFDEVTDNIAKDKKNSSNLKNDRSNSSKKYSKKKNKQTLKILRTVQESIPYEAIYKNGIIEVEPCKFSKSYYLEDTNFKVATEEEQKHIFLSYGDLLNSFGSNINIQITINNRNLDKKVLLENILLNEKGDNLDIYRKDYNEMLLEKLSEGRNNIKREKYITLTISAKDIDSATVEFNRLDPEISKAVKKMSGYPSEPIPMEKRLEILHDIYNLGKEGEFLKTARVNGQELKSFDFAALKDMGLTTKDVICPECLAFKKDYFEIGDLYGRTLYLHSLGTSLSTDFLSDLTDVPCNMVTSIHYLPIDPIEARKLVSKQITNIQADVIKAQKTAAKSGYSSQLISPSLIKAQADAQELYEEVNVNNQKLFLMTISISHFAKTIDELDSDTESIRTNGNKYVCPIRKLLYQQEKGFATSLPLGLNKLSINRLLTTDASSAFIPFSSQELAEKNGMYYGLNAVSKSLLLFNRKNSKNGNGVILGSPGSGKSFASKCELSNVLLNTDDEIFRSEESRVGKECRSR